MKTTGVISNCTRNIAFIFFLAAAVLILSVPPAFPAENSGACSSNPGSRELDYWLGDWTIKAPGGTANATSRVYLELDKCLVVESWDGGRGHAGKNMFAFSAEDKNWHGMFADNEGRVHSFEGTVALGSAEFHGQSLGPNGETELHRIRVVRVSPDKVQQTWQKSKDNGATWYTVFQGDHSRKSP
jgi:hypothetical protein